MNIDNGLVLLC